MRFNENFVGQVYELAERYQLDTSQSFAKVIKAFVERMVIIDIPECYANSELLSETARNKRDLFFMGSKQRAAAAGGATAAGGNIITGPKKSLSAQLSGTINTFPPERRPFISSMLRNIENGDFTWQEQLDHENREVREITAIIIMDGARFIDAGLNELVARCEEILQERKVD